MRNKNEDILVIFDTETTGIRKKQDRIIELAMAAVKNGKLIEFKVDLSKPKDVKIKPGAAMTHGYSNNGIKDAPAFDDTDSTKAFKSYVEKKNAYFIAHNATFDTDMLENEGIVIPKCAVIDTLKIARHLLSGDLKGSPVEKYIWDKEDTTPEMAKLQYYRYYFSGYFEKAEPKYMKKFGIDYIQPHTALSDIIVLWILTDMLMESFNLTPEDMVELTQKPALETEISFGKVFEHGTPYEEVITSTYVQWNKVNQGYNYLNWVDEEMEGKSLDREYSIKYYLAKGLLEKKIPLSTKFIKYLIWGIVFIFDKNEIEEAAKMMSVPNGYLKYISAYENGTKKKILNLEELTKVNDPDPKDLDELSKMIYMKEYFNAYRKPLFLNF